MECPLCSEKIVTNLELHFETIHKEHECPFCGVLLQSELMVNEHISVKHESIQTKQYECSVELYCPICNIITCDQKTLELHVETHFLKQDTQVSSIEKDDYQLARQLEEEELKELSRQSLRAKQEAEVDELNAKIYENEQFEMLKKQFGFNELDAFTKAKMNLSWALKRNLINKETYNSRLKNLNTEISTIIDNDSTRTSGIIGKLKEISLGKFILKRILCTACDHYSCSYVDTGYGCGYRNTQMLLSSIRYDPKLRDIVFNNNNQKMPSILKIQQLIEKAWENGFDPMGREQLGGKLKYTTKWIGSSDVAALFFSLRIEVQLIDIGVLKSNKSSNTLLIEFVKNYFETRDYGNEFMHPIYIQHQGHSRTIVGIEMTKNNGVNFLIFDPSSKQSQMENIIKEPTKNIALIRKNANTFKQKQYQLLTLVGSFNGEHEYEKSKLLKSTRLV